MKGKGKGTARAKVRPGGFSPASSQGLAHPPEKEKEEEKALPPASQPVVTTPTARQSASMLTEEDEQDWDQAGLTGLVWPNGLAGRLQPSHRQFAKAMATRKPVPQVEGPRGLMASSKTIRGASDSTAHFCCTVFLPFLLSRM